MKLMRGMTPERSFTKDGRVVDMRTGSLQDLIDSVLMVCGTPDQCYQQIKDFIEYTGGMSNLLVMAQGGFLDHKDTVRQPHAAGQGDPAAAQGAQAARRGERSGGVNLRPRRIPPVLPRYCRNLGAVMALLYDAPHDNFTTIIIRHKPWRACHASPRPCSDRSRSRRRLWRRATGAVADRASARRANRGTESQEGA